MAQEKGKSIFRKISFVLRHPIKSALFAIARIYNVLIDIRGRKRPASHSLNELEEIERRSEKRSDISDHLPVIFAETVAKEPGLIVELGVRGGESTFVFERAAKVCGSRLVSVDIDDCSNVSKMKGWEFVKADDIAFAKDFPQWCRKWGIKPGIDVLFIDTSHEYEHTKNEIKSWFPFLSSAGKVIFHDTNLREVYFRKDGSMGIGWDGKRAVMRAIEEYMGSHYNENMDFVDVKNGWIVRHSANCSGLTVMEKTG